MKRVACIGDSITWGFSIRGRVHYSYPAVLQTLLGDAYLVKNFGDNDSSVIRTADWPYVRKQVFEDSKAFAPDVVLSLLGTGDSKACNWDSEAFVRDYLQLIQDYRNLPSSPEVILLMPPPLFDEIKAAAFAPLRGDVVSSEVWPAVEKTARLSGARLIDLRPYFTDPSLLPDGVHPDRDGAAIIAKVVANSF